MKKQVVRLTEAQLHKVIKESVKRIIRERILGQGESFTPYKEGEGQKMWQASQERPEFDRNPSYAMALAKKGNKSAILYCKQKGIAF